MRYQAARQQANRDALAEIARESRKAAREGDEGDKRGAARGGGASSGGAQSRGAPSGGAAGAAAADTSDGPGDDAADEGGHERR
jgi:hypothetical protein